MWKGGQISDPGRHSKYVQYVPQYYVRTCPLVAPLVHGGPPPGDSTGTSNMGWRVVQVYDVLKYLVVPLPLAGPLQPPAAALP